MEKQLDITPVGKAARSVKVFLLVKSAKRARFIWWQIFIAGTSGTDRYARIKAA